MRETFGELDFLKNITTKSDEGLESREKVKGVQEEEEEEGRKSEKRASLKQQPKRNVDNRNQEESRIISDEKMEIFTVESVVSLTTAHWDLLFGAYFLLEEKTNYSKEEEALRSQLERGENASDWLTPQPTEAYFQQSRLAEGPGGKR